MEAVRAAQPGPSLASVPEGRRGRVLAVSHASVLAVNQHVYAGLQRLGWHVGLVVPSRWSHDYRADAFAPEVLPELAAQLMPLPVALAGRPQRHFYRQRLLPLIRRFDPDVILLEEESFSLASAQWGWAAHRAGVPFGVQAAENLERPLPGPARAFRGLTLSRSAFVTARSPAAAERARRWGARRRVELIPHAVPDWACPPKATGAVFKIGYAGRLVPEKGVRDLLAAAKQLEGPIDLLFVGDGPLRGEIERTVLKGGSIEVRTTVAHEEMPSAYAEMDVLVLPSRTTPTWTEQFGRVFVEALSCGVPVIASDSGEIPWVSAETGGGRIVPEGDVGRLAGALRDFATNPTGAADLAEVGRKNVGEKFGLRAVTRDLDRLLQSVTAADDGS